MRKTSTCRDRSVRPDINTLTRFVEIWVVETWLPSWSVQFHPDRERFPGSPAYMSNKTRLQTWKKSWIFINVKFWFKITYRDSQVPFTHATLPRPIAPPLPVYSEYSLVSLNLYFYVLTKSTTTFNGWSTSFPLFQWLAIALWSHGLTPSLGPIWVPLSSCCPSHLVSIWNIYMKFRHRRIL